MRLAMTLDQASVQAFADDIEAELVEAARPAAQAGAQVLYDEVQRNVAKIRRRTGNLARSIYQAYATKESRPGLDVYHVSYNPRKAPHGWLVEHGHLQRYEVSYDPKTGQYRTHKDRPLPTPRHVAARPYLRPAFIAKQEAAHKAMLDRLYEGLEQKRLVK